MLLQLWAVDPDIPPRWLVLFDGEPEGGSVFGVVFSPDGALLADVGGDTSNEYNINVLRLWNVATGEPLVVLHGHTRLLTDVAFNHAGTLIATASDDGTVRLWGVPE